VIELADVTKVYEMGTSEVRALDGVSLRIGEGEFVAIIGPSGSGKSTLMHLVGCLDRPTGGSYRLLGDTISGLGDRSLARVRNRSIGFVFQTFNLISRMSAWENVAVPLFYARETVTKPRALAALERVGLADRANHQPNELSGGERQRVAIARAIVNRPGLILADEPTGNLDTKTGKQIMQIFHDLHRAGTTIVLVTHEAEIAEQAERIIAMRDGKIIEDRPSSRGRRRAEPGAASPFAPPPATEPAEPPAASPPVEAAARGAGEATGSAAVLHPNARRALTWTLIGPACLLGMWGWGKTCKLLQDVNPGFVETAGPVLFVALVAMAFIAPILGIIHGRKGARWARIAPARFTGLRRALLSQWVAAFYLFAVVCLAGLAVAALWMRTRYGTGLG